jgi:hypothetical protein
MIYEESVFCKHGTGPNPVDWAFLVAQVKIGLALMVMKRAAAQQHMAAGAAGLTGGRRLRW